MRIPLLSTVLALVVAAPGAFGHDKNRADKPWYIDIGGGVLWQEEQSGIDYDPGYTINWALGYDLGELGGNEEIGWAIEFEGMFSANEFDEDDILPGIDNDTKLLAWMGNLVLDYHFTDQFAVYGGGGAGWMSRLDIDAFDDAGIDHDEDGFAWQFMAGLKYNLGGRYDVMFGYRYFTTEDIDVTGGSDYEIEQHILEVGWRWGL